MEHLILPIATDLKIEVNQVKNTLALLQEGNTVPFIARYRKEMTHGLDEEQILYISKQYDYQVKLEKRKEDVLKLIETQGKCTQEIIDAVNACVKLSEVEDIYRPYQQKRKTRATEAIRKGLQGLADYLLSMPRVDDIQNKAMAYLNEEVGSVEDALQGAMDIIAEMVSDKADLRWKIKESILNYGKIQTKQKKGSQDEGFIFKMYYEFQEQIRRVQPHRIMAIERGESLKILQVTLEYDQEWLMNYAIRGVTRNRDSASVIYIKKACEDGLKRLCFPSVEREVRAELKEVAYKKSIEIFSLNLEKLIMQAPLKGKVILGVDPAFRTGCKLAVIDQTG
ncbi:MAG: Tex-like N-terminal domain-containing protein, partial [Erysipelotrichaceae bacterium]